MGNQVDMAAIDAADARMNIVGQNGPSGDHYAVLDGDVGDEQHHVGGRYVILASSDHSVEAAEKVRALDTQEGGSHYKSLKIQPVEYIHANGIGYFEGCVIKYVSRWRSKNGLEDLRKARHFIDPLIELEATG
jgi:hypothetical protein